MRLNRASKSKANANCKPAEKMSDHYGGDFSSHRPVLRKLGWVICPQKTNCRQKEIESDDEQLPRPGLWKSRQGRLAALWRHFCWDLLKFCRCFKIAVQDAHRPVRLIVTDDQTDWHCQRSAAIKIRVFIKKSAGNFVVVQERFFQRRLGWIPMHTDSDHIGSRPITSFYVSERKSGSRQRRYT